MRKTTLLKILVWTTALSIFSATMTGCGKRIGPVITVKWSEPKPGLTVKTPVKYESSGPQGKVWLDVGRVIEIMPEKAGAAVKVGLYSATAHYLTSKTDFLFQEGNSTNPCCIIVEVLDRDAPPISDGAVFQGSNSQIGSAIKKGIINWPRTLLLAVVGVLLVLLLIVVAKFIVHFWPILVCVLAGTAGAIYLRPFFQNMLSAYIPEGALLRVVAAVVGFAVGLAVVAVLFALLRASPRMRRHGHR